MVEITDLAVAIAINKKAPLSPEGIYSIKSYCLPKPHIQSKNCQN